MKIFNIIWETIKEIISRIIKSVYKFWKWFFFSEFFSLFMFMLSLVLFHVKDKNTPIQTNIKDMACHGEFLIICIPLIFGLVLELYRRRKRSTGLFMFSIILLFLYGFSYPLFASEIAGKVTYISLIVVIPLVTVNLMAFIVIFTATNKAKGKK